MENVFSHELVGVIKKSCFARHSTAVRPTLLVIGETEQDPLLMSVLKELVFDSTLSTSTVSAYNESVLQRSLLVATVVLTVGELPRRSLEQIALSHKPLLEWGTVKRNACPLFWPAHNVMDFFIVHQDSLVKSPTRTISQEGEGQ